MSESNTKASFEERGSIEPDCKVNGDYSCIDLPQENGPHNNPKQVGQTDGLCRDCSPQSESVSSTIDVTEENEDSTNTSETGKLARRRRKRRKTKMTHVEDTVSALDKNESKLNEIGATSKPEYATPAVTGSISSLTRKDDLNGTNPFENQNKGSEQNCQHRLKHTIPETAQAEAPPDMTNHCSHTIGTEDRTHEDYTKHQSQYPPVAEVKKPFFQNYDVNKYSFFAPRMPSPGVRQQPPTTMYQQQGMRGSTPPFFPGNQQNVQQPRFPNVQNPNQQMWGQQIMYMPYQQGNQPQIIVNPQLVKTEAMPTNTVKKIDDNEQNVQPKETKKNKPRKNRSKSRNATKPIKDENDYNSSDPLSKSDTRQVNEKSTDVRQENETDATTVGGSTPDQLNEDQRMSESNTKASFEDRGSIEPDCKANGDYSCIDSPQENGLQNNQNQVGQTDGLSRDGSPQSESVSSTIDVTEDNEDSTNTSETGKLARRRRKRRKKKMTHVEDTVSALDKNESKLNEIGTTSKPEYATPAVTGSISSLTRNDDLNGTNPFENQNKGSEQNCQHQLKNSIPETAQAETPPDMTNDCSHTIGTEDRTHEGYTKHQSQFPPVAEVKNPLPFFPGKQQNVRQPRFPNVQNPNQQMWGPQIMYMPSAPYQHQGNQPQIIVNPQLPMPQQRMQQPYQNSGLPTTQATSGLYQTPSTGNVNFPRQGYNNPPVYYGQNNPQNRPPSVSGQTSNMPSKKKKTIIKIVDSNTDKHVDLGSQQAETSGSDSRTISTASSGTEPMPQQRMQQPYQNSGLPTTQATSGLYQVPPTGIVNFPHQGYNNPPVYYGQNNPQNRPPSASGQASNMPSKKKKTIIKIVDSNTDKHVDLGSQQAETSGSGSRTISTTSSGTELPELRRVESPENDPVSSETEINNESLQGGQKAKKKKRQKKKGDVGEDTVTKLDDKLELNVTDASLKQGNDSPSAFSTTSSSPMSDMPHNANRFLKTSIEPVAPSSGLTLTQSCQIIYSGDECGDLKCQYDSSSVNADIPTSKLRDKQVMNKDTAASSGSSPEKKGMRKMNKANVQVDQRLAKGGISTEATQKETPSDSVTRGQCIDESEIRDRTIHPETQLLNSATTERHLEVKTEAKAANTVQKFDDNEQNVQPKGTKKNKPRKNRSESRDAAKPIKDVKENNKSDPLSKSDTRQVYEKSTDVCQENETDTTAISAQPPFEPSKTEIDGNIDEERRGSSSHAAPSDDQQGKPQDVQHRVSSYVETIYEAPYTTQNSATPCEEYKVMNMDTAASSGSSPKKKVKRNMNTANEQVDQQPMKDEVSKRVIPKKSPPDVANRDKCTVGTELRNSAVNPGAQPLDPLDTEQQLEVKTETKTTTTETQIDENYQGVQPKLTQKLKPRKNKSKPRHADKSLKNEKENITSDSLSHSGTRQVIDKSTGVHQENETDTTAISAQPPFEPSKIEIDGNIAEERRGSSSAAAPSDGQQGKAQDVQHGDPPDVETIYEAPYTTQNSATPCEEYKMAASICRHIQESLDAKEKRDLKKAKQMALQAMLGATEAKEEFLKGGNFAAQPLADWFGQCALILHETKAFISAIKCFYTATVFDGFWDIEDHVRVAHTLWDNILNQKSLVETQTEKVYEVLHKVYEVAVLALTRRLYRLCSRICTEVDSIYGLLVKKFQVCKLGRYHTDIKPVFMCRARAHYQTGDYVVASAMCAAILQEMCDFDCSEAFELWGMVLMKEKNFERAAAKFQMALKYAKDQERKTKLAKMLNDVCKNHKLVLGDEEKTEIRKQRYQDTSVQHNDHNQGSSQSRVPRFGNTRAELEPGTSRPRNFYAETEADANDDTPQLPYEGRSVHNQAYREIQEVTTFYEQSRRLYIAEGRPNHGEISESNYQQMLVSGLTLNMSYMHQYADKPNAQYTQDPYYAPCKSEEVLRRLLLNRHRFLRCELQIESAHVAYCKPLDNTPGIELVEIAGRSKAGQAFSDDEVVVELLDTRHDDKGKRFGQVIGILKRNRYPNVDHPVFLCTLDEMQSHFVRPICKTVPKLSVLDHVIWQKFRKMKKYKVELYKYDENSETIGDPEVLDINIGDLQKYVFMVVFINWTPRKVYPRGAIIRMLDYGDTLTSGLTLLNLRHSVPSLYGRPVVETIQQNGLDNFDEIQAEDFYGREDLRNLTIFTIDPEGSKDLDDALSIEHLRNGYRVGVHIADVSQFVLKDDPVDEEARERATTFYPSIPGKLPRNMLPEPLSSNVCSLLPNKCRLTLSVFFLLSEKGELLNRNSTDARKTIIRSHERFTYRDVQKIIEGKEHRLQQEITLLHNLTYRIRKRRLGNAMFAIDLSNDDDEDASTVGESFEAHYLVEELMIMANGAVARKLISSFPKCVPLRCQPPPPEEHVDAFLTENGNMIDIVVKLQDRKLSDGKTSSVISLLGTSPNIDDSTMVAVPKHIWNIINASSKEKYNHSVTQDAAKVLCTDDIFPLQHLIYQRWIALRKPAEYKCTGAVDNTNSLRHYELEVYPYTHFTSPIRRYIDLVVHRLLHAAIDNDESPYSEDEIDGICHDVNRVSKRAKDFQRDCKVLKNAVELKKNPKMLHCYVEELSDRSIGISSPDMKNVPRNYRELAFNLLDMGYKPELNNDNTTLNATWKKRLYDLSGVSTQLSDRRGEIRLNSNQGVVFIPVQKWARILKSAMEDHKSDLKNALTNSNVRAMPSGNADDVSTESLHTNIPLPPNTMFSLAFQKGQLLKVQLSAVPLKGILTPRPMLYNMTHNVKLCLQHTDDAVLHLSRYVNKCTLDQYESVEKYLKMWIPLIQMEAATCAIANEESCLISNVKVRFDTENEREGWFTVLTEYCELRNIDFSGAISEKDEDDTDESAEAYDWLCIRYSIPGPVSTQTSCSVVAKLESIWVGHAEVSGVRKRVDGKTVVNFKLHERCPPVPVESKRKGAKFSVEILRKSEVDRRTESFLKRLEMKEYRNILANTIALNKKPIPNLDQLHLEMARTIERDVVTPELKPNNLRQQEAIDKALHSRMSLIQGPPGTGKTVTGVKLMYLFDKINQMICSETGQERRQVLYCGPCNKSVDLVGRLLKEKLGIGLLCPKFVRVYGRSIESIEFPIPGRTFLSKKSTRALKADEELQDVALHHLIRKPDRPYAKEIKAFDQQFKKNNYVVSLDDTKKYMNLLRTASVEEIKKYGVILCTTAVGSNPKILKAANVFQVLVDEAGMCPEPQCLMPIIATKAEQVVLIGDHKQLRPIIICNQAAELGLQTSLFEKLYLSKTAKSVKFTMLNWQYRMNPLLCAFPSKQFYEDKLVTRDSPSWAFDRMANLWPKFERQWCPHVFIPVEGEEKTLTVATEEGNEHSKSNKAEVDIVMRILRYFIEAGIDGEEVNVISQYNAQCAVIRNSIAEQGFQNCNVSTVVSSQGGEWDYVIFSTVRSLPLYKIERNPTIGWCQQNLGFITDKNQINVALTRARKGLIIIGNQNLLRCDKVFKDLLVRYDHYGCIKSVDEFLPRRGSRLKPHQRYGKLEMRRWIMDYNEGRFIPGLPPTSFKGDVDNVSPYFDDDDDAGSGRVLRRGKRKVLPTRKPQT